LILEDLIIDFVCASLILQLKMQDLIFANVMWWKQSQDNFFKYFFRV